jgi:hypothetical protein
MKIDYDVPTEQKDLNLVTDYQMVNSNAMLPPESTNTSVPTPNNLQKVGTGGEALNAHLR